MLPKVSRTLFLFTIQRHRKRSEAKPSQAIFSFILESDALNGKGKILLKSINRIGDKEDSRQGLGSVRSEFSFCVAVCACSCVYSYVYVHVCDVYVCAFSFVCIFLCVRVSVCTMWESEVNTGFLCHSFFSLLIFETWSVVV